VVVYFMFFKLLGVLLMLLELVWFIARPVWSEASHVLSNWRSVRIAWRPVGATAALALVGVWLMPVAGEVSAPALIRAEHEQLVYAPFPARIAAVEVERAGSVVAKDAPLVKLELADLKTRTALAQVAIASAQVELARTPASERQQERRAVLEQQLARANAEMQAVNEDAGRQQLRAAHAGRIRDLARDLVPGQWVGPRHLLMRVVTDTAPLIEAFVSERQLAAVVPGQTVRFYSSLPNTPVIEGRVVAVERTPIKEITQPLLASTHGGDILVNPSAGGTLVANEAVFRVSVKPLGAVPPVAAVTRGTVRIEGGLRYVAENFLSRTLSVLIRESGF
jgi:putative peptide zinc metalloprotease protein